VRYTWYEHEFVVSLVRTLQMVFSVITAAVSPDRPNAGTGNK